MVDVAHSRVALLDTPRPNRSLQKGRAKIRMDKYMKFLTNSAWTSMHKRKGDEMDRERGLKKIPCRAQKTSDG